MCALGEDGDEKEAYTETPAVVEDLCEEDANKFILDNRTITAFETKK